MGLNRISIVYLSACGLAVLITVGVWLYRRARGSPLRAKYRVPLSPERQRLLAATHHPDYAAVPIGSPAPADRSPDDGAADRSTIPTHAPSDRLARQQSLYLDDHLSQSPEIASASFVQRAATPTLAMQPEDASPAHSVDQVIVTVAEEDNALSSTGPNSPTASVASPSSPALTHQSLASSTSGHTRQPADPPVKNASPFPSHTVSPSLTPATIRVAPSETTTELAPTMETTCSSSPPPVTESTPPTSHWASSSPRMAVAAPTPPTAMKTSVCGPNFKFNLKAQEFVPRSFQSQGLSQNNATQPPPMARQLSGMSTQPGAGTTTTEPWYACSDSPAGTPPAARTSPTGTDRDSASVGLGPSSLALHGRCRLWPSCTDKHCKHAPPTEPCPHLPDCPHGPQCANLCPQGSASPPQPTKKHGSKAKNSRKKKKNKKKSGQRG